MRPSLSSRLAWAIFVVCVLLTVLTVLFTAFYRFPFWDLALVFAFLVTPAVGALVASRHPQNPIGWLLLATGLVFGVAATTNEYAALSEEKSLPLGPELGALGGPAFMVTLVSGAVLLPLLFPNGRLLSPRWRWAVYLAGVALLVGAMGYLILPGRLEAPRVESENPFGVEGATWVRDFGFLLLLALMATAAISLLLRFLRAGGEERQQMKWIVFAALLMALAAALGISLENKYGEATWMPFYVLLFFGLPASIGAAILRYRLYDIDRIINRTLTYGLLTATLGAGYLGLVVGLQALLRPVSGGSDLALVMTTLAVAALFLPARRTVQRAVDRRFNRRTYDAARTIDAFGARLRDQIDLDTLRYELLSVVDETMQPSGVSLWLRVGG